MHTKLSSVIRWKGTDPSFEIIRIKGRVVQSDIDPETGYCNIELCDTRTGANSRHVIPASFEFVQRELVILDVVEENVIAVQIVQVGFFPFGIARILFSKEDALGNILASYRFVDEGELTEGERDDVKIAAMAEQMGGKSC